MGWALLCVSMGAGLWAAEEGSPAPVVPDLERAADPELFLGKRVGSVEVVVIGPNRLKDLSRVITVKPGGKLSAREVSRSIELLYRLGAIDDVLAEAEDTPAGLRVRFKIWPATLVREVTFKGNREIGARRLRGQLTMRAGSAYTESDVRAQAANLARYYNNEGFLNASVQPEARKVRRGRMDVQFHIVEGTQARIRELRFEDSEFFAPRALQQASGLEEGRPYRPSALEESRKAVQQYLREEGHLGARVRFLPEVHPAKEQVTLRCEVEEGPRIALEFYRKGLPLAGPFGGALWHRLYRIFPWARNDDVPRRIEWLRRRQLLKILDLEGEQQFTTGFAEEAAERIQSTLIQEGFDGPRVSAGRKLSADGREETFRFTIDPGTRIRIQKVAFQGNVFFDEQTLIEVFDEAMERFAPPGIYTEEALDQALPLVADFYRSQGFMDIRLNRQVQRQESPLGARMDIKVRVEEGPRTLVSEVSLQGYVVVAEEVLRPLVSIAPGEPYDPNKVRQTVERIRALYASKGYVNALVMSSWEAQPSNPTAVTVRFEIDEGTQARFGEIIVRGARRTRPGVIDREIAIKSGEVYTPEKVEESRRHLNDTGLFQKASIYPVEGERVRDMMVEVQERKAGAVALSGGVLFNGFQASIDDATFDVAFELSHINMWGLGHRAAGRLELETTYLPNFEKWQAEDPFGSSLQVLEDLRTYLEKATSRRIVLTYQSPYLFGTRLNSILTGTLFERDVELFYLIDRNSLAWAISRDLTRRLNGSFQLQAVVRRPDETQTDARVQLWPIDEQQRLMLMASSVLLYDRRDSRLDPTKGYLLSLQGEVGQAFGCGAQWSGLTIKDCPGGMLSPEESYLRFSGTASALWPILSWLRLETRTQGGFYLPLGQAALLGDVPMEKRFYLGGAGTVRGFSQNSLGPVRFAEKDIPQVLVPSGTVVPTGGNASFSYTLELQFPLKPLSKTLESWELAVFHDAGNVFWTGASRDWFDSRAAEDTFPPLLDPGCQALNGARLRPSVGVGVRWRTGVFPIRFDLGFPLERRCEEVEEVFNAHLSIGLF